MRAKPFTAAGPNLAPAVFKAWQASGKQLILTVQGRSMVPNLLPGQRVVIRCVPAGELSCGDIFAFGDQNGIIVHRFVKQQIKDGAPRVCQKGDGLLGWRWLDPVQVLGVVERIEGRHGSRDLRLKPWVLYNRAWGAAAKLYITLCETARAGLRKADL